MLFRWTKQIVPPMAACLGTLLLAAILSVAETAKAEDAAREPAQKWVRVLRDEAGRPLAMQTAVVRYEPQDREGPAVSVDLIGAVHVGDRKYYNDLNRRFEDYDALLYELVAPKNVRVPQGRGTSNRHPVGALQNGLKGMLELEHQLERVDYTKKNFVHADMSPDEFSKKMAERDESFLQLIFRMMGQGIAQQSKEQATGRSTDFNLLAALFAKDRAVQLKRIMAEQFADMESMLVGFGGPDGSTIITERNKVALAVLKQELAAGKTQLGIFYGAGHMADMDKRLREEFRLLPTATEWITAWQLGAED